MSENNHFNISTPRLEEYKIISGVYIKKHSGNTLSFLTILKILLNLIIMLTKLSWF